MMNSIKGGMELSDRTPDRRAPRKEDQASETAARLGADPDQTGEADLRLLIERDAQGDAYVYKLVDRATGKVVAERPRDEVAHLAEGPDYRAGAVIRTKA